MSIDLDDEEYRLLLQMLLLAEWVMFADNYDDPMLVQQRELLHKLISQADRFGLKDSFEFNREFNRFIPTDEFEQSEGYMNLLDRFIDNSFWEELLARMTERDLMEQLGSEAYDQLAPEQRSSMLKELEEFYYQEFRDNGIDNLTIQQNKTQRTLH